MVADLQIEVLDKKLILAIQYVCNADGIRIPWDKVGAIMGEGISDGAVVQHLAKLRQRLIALKLEVPPPLRRGGGYAIPTSGGNLGSSSSTLRKSAKKATGAQVSSSTTLIEENEEDFDEENPDAVLGKTRSKQAKRNSKNQRRNSKVKKGASDEDEELVSGIIKRMGHQREKTDSAANKGQEKEIAKNSKPAVRARRSLVQYNEISECDSDEYQESQSENAEHNIIEEDFVAARATFLRAESPYKESEAERNNSLVSLTPKKTMSNSSSKIVVLQFGNSRRARNFLGDLACIGENETDLESESQDEQDEMEDELSEDEFNVNKATMNPNMGNKQAEHTAVAFDQPSRDGLHPFGETFRNTMAIPYISQDMAHELSHNTTSHSLDTLNSAPTTTEGVSLYADNSTMAGVQGEMYDFSRQNGQTFVPSWNDEVGEHSRSDRNQIPSPHDVHRYSTARFDSAPAPNPLYPQTLNVSGYNSPNNLQQSGDRIGNQHTMAFDQHANFEIPGIMHSSMAGSLNDNRRNRDMPNQSMGSHYQSYSVDRDMNREQVFPATQQRMLSPSTCNAVQQVNGPSIPNESFPANNTTSGNYDLSPLDHMSLANFDSSHVHSAGQVHGDMQNSLEDGDEYSMMDAFDFEAFDSDFGNENMFA